MEINISSVLFDSLLTSYSLFYVKCEACVRVATVALTTYFSNISSYQTEEVDFATKFILLVPVYFDQNLIWALFYHYSVFYDNSTFPIYC